VLTKRLSEIELIYWNNIIMAFSVAGNNNHARLAAMFPRALPSMQHLEIIRLLPSRISDPHVKVV
jgi:hypothetical protein